jgi:hypothetical protein
MPTQNINSGRFSNTNLNSVGSEFAANYGHGVSTLVQKMTNKLIFDAAPQQFLDLSFLNQHEVESNPSDEFFYQEATYQREAIVATGSAAAVSYPATQIIPVASLDFVSTNMIVVYPGNYKGVITDFDTSALTITVTPYTNKSLPAVAANDLLANLSTIDHDGSEGFAQYFRMSTIERSNYIQLFNRAIRYGEVELHKMRNAGTTSNFLSMERDKLFEQHRIDISNAFWNGQKGEVKTANGTPAKTTGGVYSTMVEAGSPKFSATASTLVDAFEEAILASEYGSYGAVRMAFMTPTLHRMLSLKYKDEHTRYEPQNDMALLNLKEINIGSSRIVLCPYKRFEDSASFPAEFANRIAILDMKNMKRVQMWGERSGDTLALGDGIPKRYGEVYVDSNMGVKFNNPLACATVDVQM